MARARGRGQASRAVAARASARRKRAEISPAEAAALRAADRAAAAGKCLSRLVAALESVDEAKLRRMKPAVALHLAEKLARIYRDIEGSAVSVAVSAQLAVFLPEKLGEAQWEQAAQKV